MDVYVSDLGSGLGNSSRPGDFQSTYICVLVIVLYRLYSYAALYGKGLCKEKQIPKIRVYYGSGWVGPGLTRKLLLWKIIPK